MNAQIEFTRADEIDAKAEKFHHDNPQVWKLFREAAFNRISLGFEHYSMYAAGEHARWVMDTNHNSKTEFKFNNNYRPWYARKFHNEYPEHDGFFRTRHRTSEDQPALGLRELGPADFPYNNQPPIDPLLQ